MTPDPAGCASGGPALAVLKSRGLLMRTLTVEYGVKCHYTTVGEVGYLVGGNRRFIGNARENGQYPTGGEDRRCPTASLQTALDSGYRGTLRTAQPE